MFVLLLHFYSTTPTPAYGEIAKGLRDRGHKVWIGQPADDGSFVFLDGEAAVDRLPGARLESGGRFRFLPFMIRLRAHVRGIHPDVVQITPAPWSWLLACRHAVDTVFLNDIRTAGSGAGRDLRAMLVDWSAWISWRIGSAWLFDRTLFLNEAGARWLLGSRWAHRADVVPLGVGTHFLRAAARPCADPTARPVRFVYLGTISLERNLRQLLLAVRAVRAGPPEFLVTLLGPDDGAGSLAAIRDLIERERLQDVVDLMAPVSYQQVPDVLRHFDVALNYIPLTRVMRRQPPLKVIECCALGLPQITARTASSAAIVRDGETGLLVEDSVEAHVGAMQRLIEDPALLDRLTRQAQQSRAGATWTEVADQYAAIYEVQCRPS